MLSLIPYPYKMLGVLAAVLCIASISYYRGYAGEHDSFIAYQSKVAQTAAEQATQAKKIDEKHTKEKELLDEQNNRTLADNVALTKRLHNYRNRSSYLPPAKTDTRNAERICFSRNELDRAIRQLDDEVQGLIGQGDDARISLDTAKMWAAEN